MMASGSLEGVLATERLLLAVVFGVAGLAKLADCAGTRAALLGRDVPARIARHAAGLLPLGELAIAGALLSKGFAREGAFGASVLLLVFTALSAHDLARGRASGCGCLGPISRATTPLIALLRNQGLTALALMVVWFGHPSSAPAIADWISSMTFAERAAILIGTGLVALAAIAPELPRIVLPRRKNATRGRHFGEQPSIGPASIIHARPGFPAAGLPVGTRVGRTRASPTLLVFVSPGSPRRNPLAIAVDPSLGGMIAVETIDVTTPEGRRSAGRFRVPAVPAAVIVRDGRIASRLAIGASAIDALVVAVARACTRQAEPPAFRVASPSSFPPASSTAACGPSVA
jgi:hypothetical protein